MGKKIEIFVLTHKKIHEDFDKTIYKPLLNGAVYNDKGFDYLKDNIGDNISELNPYYSELTGEYWAWKNSKNEIIGFCHYRRWFVKNFKLEKLAKSDILKSLKEYDIILPKKLELGCTFNEFIYRNQKIPEDGVDELGEITRKILTENYQDYVRYYDKYLNNNYFYAYNIFICKRQLANDYFEWLFDILKKYEKELDSSKTNFNIERYAGYVSERLLGVYILKNNLKIKEYPIHYTESSYPHLIMILNSFPKFRKFIETIYLIYSKLNKIKLV